MTNSKRAFSLIEVLIVIAIIALGASLVLPVVKGNKDKANYVVSRDNLYSIGKAMEKSYLETGSYPVFKDWGQVSAADSPLNEFLNQVPANDAWGRPFNVAESTEKGYKFEGLSIQGKLAKEHPDYYVVNGPKMKNKGDK